VAAALVEAVKALEAPSGGYSAESMKVLAGMPPATPTVVITEVPSAG